MRILLDVDGVIADLVGDLCRELRASGYKREPEDFTSYEFSSVLPRDEAAVAHGAMIRPGFVQTMSWYPGAKAFVKALQSVAKVVAVTKPFPAGPTWAYERAIWLKGHIDTVIQTEHKELIPGDILIEDYWLNAQKWQTAHPKGHAILIERPWCNIYSQNLPIIGASSYDMILGALEGLS